MSRSVAFVGAAERARRERAIEIRRSEAVELRIELRQRRRRLAQRIDVRQPMAAHAIGANQLVDAILQHARAHAYGRRGTIRSGTIAARGAVKQALRGERRPQLRLAQKATISAGQRREEPPPVVADAGRVAYVVAVQAFDEGQAVAVEGYVFGLHRIFV